jgi:hypothetical protein
MDATPDPLKPRDARKAAKPSAGAIALRSGVAVALVTVAVVGVARLESGGVIWPPHQGGDDVSPADRQMRADAFAAMAPLPLALVSDRDLPRAIAGMGLSPARQRAMWNATAAPVAASIAPSPTASAAPQPQAPPASPSRDPVARTAQAAPARLQLAWLTLWDTDVEDGDVVRIDSAGYSRTVTLTKAPLTFAIPVPPTGVVTVTGIRDGDGGGITVGLASGGARAVFPIMSAGQVLGLRVRIV